MSANVYRVWVMISSLAYECDAKHTLILVHANVRSKHTPQCSVTLVHRRPITCSLRLMSEDHRHAWYRMCYTGGKQRKFIAFAERLHAFLPPLHVSGSPHDPCPATGPCQGTTRHPLPPLQAYTVAPLYYKCYIRLYSKA